MPLSALRHAARTIRQDLALFGWRDGCLYLLARALERTTRGRCRLIKYYFAVQPVPEGGPRTAERPAKTRIYEARPDDPIVAQFPRPPEVIAWRFRDGARCFVAELSGTLVGFIWFKHASYEEDEVRCQYVLAPARDIVWEFDVYLDPRFRMSRAFQQLWGAAHEFLRSAGYRWSAGRTSAFNAISLAAHRRLGPQTIAKAVFLLLGPLQVAFFSTSPRFHCGLRATDRPTLIIRAPASRETS